MSARADGPEPANRNFTAAGILARVPVILAWLALFLSLLCLYFRLGSAGPKVLDSVWITSDSLYPVNVATDVLHDGYSLSGWKFSVAPCWFPDLFATALFWEITRNAINATLLAGFIQLALIVGAFQLMHRAIGLGSAALQTVLLLGVSVWITLHVAAHPAPAFAELFRFFIPQSHVGGLIMSLYAMALAFWLLVEAHSGSGRSRALRTVYAGICLLGGMSNLMFFPQMLAPFTTAVALAVFFEILPASECWVPVALGWPAAIIGAILNRAVFHATSVAAQSQVSRDAAVLALEVFARGALKYLFEPIQILAALWFGACLAAAALILRKLIRSHHLRLPIRLLWVFCCCWVFSDLFSAGVIILGGSSGLTIVKSYPWTTHYLQAIFFIPLFGLPLLIAWLLPQRFPPAFTRAVAWSGSVLMAVVAAIYLGASQVPRPMVASYRPPLVHFLDDMASAHGFKYGIAGYWQSRITTLLSQKGVRVYAVEPAMKPHLWVSNMDWYTESLADHRQPPPFHFIVLDDPAFKLSRDTAVETFGEPTEEASFDNTRVLLYRAALQWAPVLVGIDAPLTQFNEQISSPVKSLLAKPGETISVPVLIRNPTSARWASYGNYPVNLSYRWFASGRMLNIEGVRSFPGQVKPGGSVSLAARVLVPKEGTDLTLKLSMVQEGVAWFYSRGAATCDISVKVQ